MRTHAFKVRTGWAVRHSSDLILRPDRVQLNDEVLLADEIEWIRMQVLSLIHTGVKTGTTSTLELGGAHKSLQFSLYDMLYSTVRTDTFSEIWSVVHRFYGSRIIQGMLNILAAGGSLVGVGSGSWCPGKHSFQSRLAEVNSRPFVLGPVPMDKCPAVLRATGRSRSDEC